MSSRAGVGRLQWPVVVPVLALLILAVTWFHHEHWAVLTVVALALVGSIISAVHHAEVVAHKVGEPFGSLILAVAVTVIEVGLIVMLMTGGGPRTSSYAPDTLFAAGLITPHSPLGGSPLGGGAPHPPGRLNPPPPRPRPPPPTPPG